MKRLALIGMLCLAIVVSAACAAPANNKENNPATAPADQDSGQNGGSQPEQAEETEEPSPEPEPEYPTTFNIGDVLVYPGQYEISMVSTELTTKVIPPNADGFYTYYEVKEPDKIYVHNVFKVKNLGGSALGADDIMNVKVVYDGKYEYNGFATIEESGGKDFTYTNITSISPLTNGTLHFLVEVPLEVKDSDKSLDIQVTAGGQTLTSTGNEAEGERLVVAAERELPENTSWQQFTAIGSGETVIDEDYAELSVLNAEFTTKVVPPNASGYYSFYEVKDPSNIYAHISFAFKNLMPIGKSADEAISVRLVYDNKYEFRGFSTIEENNGSDFTYTNITSIKPLTTANLHYIIEVPLEAQESGLPIVFKVRMNDKDYYYELPR